MNSVGVTLNRLAKWHWYVMLQHQKAFSKVCGMVPRTSTRANIVWKTRSDAGMANYWALAYRAGVGKGTLVWSTHPNKKGRYTDRILILLHAHENYHLLANTGSEIGTFPPTQAMINQLRKYWGGPPVKSAEELQPEEGWQPYLLQNPGWRPWRWLRERFQKPIEIPFDEDGNDAIQRAAEAMALDISIEQANP